MDNKVKIEINGEIKEGTVTDQKENIYNPGTFFYTIELEDGKTVVYYGEFES